MAKKKEEPEFYLSMLNNPMLNYNTYKMKKIEKIVYIILAFVVGGLVGQVFYGNLFTDNGDPTQLTRISNAIVFIIVGAIVAKVFIPLRQEQLKEKRQNLLKVQFRDMLDALSTSFMSGDNTIKAFESAYKDMQQQYPADSFIVRELAEIVGGINNNISVEKSLENFALRSGIEDIIDFANVYSLAFEKGGDLSSVTRNCYNIIGDKMAIEDEIKTKVTSNRTQQRVMSVAPIAIIAFLRMSSESMAQNFATVKGVVVMTIAIGIFYGSFRYGEKITNIKG